MSRGAALVSAAVVAVLALLLAALLAAPGPLASLRHWSPPPPQAPNLSDARAAALQPSAAAGADYPAVLQQPLFSPTRKPELVITDDKTPEADTNPLDKMQISGLIAASALAGAVLTSAGQPPQFMRVGDAISGWTLVRLDNYGAVFRHDGKERTVPLAIATDNPPADARGRTRDKGPVGGETVFVPRAPPGASRAGAQGVRTLSAGPAEADSKAPAGHAPAGPAARR